MTGYGRATQHFEDKVITIEVRSLNSKYTDVRFKLPQNYKEKEHLLRREVTDRLKRGKIDVLIDVISSNGEDAYGLNHALIKKYYRELTKLSGELAVPTGDILAAILRIPNVVISEEGTLREEEWAVVEKTLQEAMKAYDHFRKEEGNVLAKELQERIENIQQMLEEIKPYEDERIVGMRHKLRQRIDEYLNKEEVDENRFEQELLFYLEKIDLTEEKVRLAQHCKYFLEEMKKKEDIKGRKLGFISQEIGREINTMGAKAYSYEIQRLVVNMKDELEK
ncbi:MAG: YicC family protein [Saprospiraceae bacterium]|nr:YicC family protein [Saprospiraceae bacterium]